MCLVMLPCIAAACQPLHSDIRLRQEADSDNEHATSSNGARWVDNSRVCDNGEGGMGPCFAGDIGPMGSDTNRKLVYTSFGEIGRRMGETVALEHCGLSRESDPSSVDFSEALQYVNAKGETVTTTVYDIAAYSFECPTAGKVIQ